jgi:hypothetical protein
MSEPKRIKFTVIDVVAIVMPCIAYGVFIFKFVPMAANIDLVELPLLLGSRYRSYFGTSYAAVSRFLRLSLYGWHPLSF